MTALAVQYLEPSPASAALPPDAVRARLQAACQRLPITYVLLGWNLPASLVTACRDVASAARAELFLWHPLLIGDRVFLPRPEWQTVGLHGEPVPGYQGMPEFTFVCPNRPAVREAALEHL